MNILNPLHYIAVNNPAQTCEMLTKKYQLNRPRSESEMMKAVDKMTHQHGQNFACDMLKLHPDAEAIIKIFNLQQVYPNHSFSNVEGQNKTQNETKPTPGSGAKHINIALVVFLSLLAGVALTSLFKSE